jgi:HAD superfamily hydrolase (TIGR01509 family)
VYGLGNRKNAEVQRRIAEDGVRVFEGSRRYLQAAAQAGLRRFVVSSSANTGLVLRVTGLDELVEGRIDGVTLVEKHIPGKPEPDSFLAGAALAGAPPDRAVVFEDALAGVAAGRAGGFGYVVGVDRVGQAAELAARGADVVVTDLAELLEAAS